MIENSKLPNSIKTDHQAAKLKVALLPAKLSSKLLRFQAAKLQGESCKVSAEAPSAKLLAKLLWAEVAQTLCKLHLEIKRQVSKA